MWGVPDGEGGMPIWDLSAVYESLKGAPLPNGLACIGVRLFIRSYTLFRIQDVEGLAKSMNTFTHF